MAHPPVTQRYHEHVPHDHRPKSAWRGLATPTYPQVFEDRLGFVAGRSILDVLFHVGPEAPCYLRAMETSTLKQTALHEAHVKPGPNWFPLLVTKCPCNTRD